MKRVLILTASYGDGHQAAAQNLCNALELVSPEAKVAVLDPLQSSYGAFNTAARSAYNGIVRYAPSAWNGIYQLLDSTSKPEKRLIKFSRLRKTLGNLIQDTQPDCVVSTYPLYATVIQDLYRDHAERPFRLVTAITDSITINAAWTQAPSDIYCVANDATAQVLRARGIKGAQIRALGFPVSPLFCQMPVADRDAGAPGNSEPSCRSAPIDRQVSKLARLTLSPHQMEEYFEVIERERRRAWRKYNMLVMTGLEFNKDGLTRKSSAHLLGIDLTMPLADNLDLPETIAHIHAQGGLAIASHPHIMKSEWGKNTLYLWEHQETFAPLLDAWEVANRNNMFNPVSTKRLPYVANSDFHKPKHIYSWKTLVYCEKSAAAIKDCVRNNDHVAITLYRDGETVSGALSTREMLDSDYADSAQEGITARLGSRSLLLPAA
jgi:hypothetical protein